MNGAGESAAIKISRAIYEKNACELEKRGN